MKQFNDEIMLTYEELKEVVIAMVKQWVEETSDGSSIDEETEKDLKIYLKPHGISFEPKYGHPLSSFHPSAIPTEEQKPLNL